MQCSLNFSLDLLTLIECLEVFGGGLLFPSSVYGKVEVNGDGPTSSTGRKIIICIKQSKINGIRSPRTSHGGVKAASQLALICRVFIPENAVFYPSGLHVFCCLVVSVCALSKQLQSCVISAETCSHYGGSPKN